MKDYFNRWVCIARHRASRVIRFCFARKCPPRTFEMSAPFYLCSSNTAQWLRVEWRFSWSTPVATPRASRRARPTQRRHREETPATSHLTDWLTFLITGEKSRKFTSKLVLRQHHRFQVISGCRERSCLKKWQQEASAGVSWSLVTWSAEVHRCADWHVRKSRGKSWPHCAPLMLCGQPAAYTVPAHAC